MLLRASVFFIVLAIIAAFLGFGGIASEGVWLAKAAFVLFLVMAAVSFIAGRRVQT